ncbi:MAG: ribosomal protein S18-alanine N-acetyltransferase [Rhodospirillaceae bacterium]|jgi:[ribosomal protein S18]-alanine N-acetyltransferase|nr:ribosomal protein S18-alanine N-acetyltransferase [Rhodospirillaceae bacterium]MBT4218841.1 ribosomal protein S18-alanine N-acetyltransferase [Rhodospirillaceae bacterium]MBT4463844.1 ribosomal protein S18-alanine N-acetyltransferase [Rhodospirillaceae bacterium]MBT5012954.1 ribosomal protein S18-alanine N-acetyltransferase [Rhodospirillaceae bacterium]MBT5308502.1 ribosomal protein S18-alanine N-acetyltransferase [Rhodospirillaceae bacterium]
MTTIIDATPAHAGVIAALHEMSFDASGDHWDEKSVAEILAMPGAFGLLIDIDGQPAGFILARLAADEAEIISIGIVEQARRQGLASDLLAAVRQRVQAKESRHLFLEVATDNSGAEAFYVSHGFKACGRRKDYYRRKNGRVDALVMRLEPVD